MNRLMADLNVDRARNPNHIANDRWSPTEEEVEEAEEDAYAEINDEDIIDRRESLLYIYEVKLNVTSISTKQENKVGKKGTTST